MAGYTGGIFDEEGDLDSLMDEARTMLRVGSYHENIVNLQGITSRSEGNAISQVS